MQPKKLVLCAKGAYTVLYSSSSLLCMPEFLSTDTLLYGALALAFLSLVWNGYQEYRLRKLLRGKSGATLEHIINALLTHRDDTEQFRAELELYLEEVERRLKKSVRAVETVRFNPFRGDGSGGNQSFAAAFLNEEGGGIVLSSIFARDRVSTYAKPIVEHGSVYELSEEEIEALARAKKLLGK